MSDSNANMKTKAVHMMGVVVVSVGPSVAKLANLVGSKLVAGVADNKNAMQQACLDSLRNWVVHGDVASAKLLGWTVEMTHMVAGKMDLRTMVETTIDTLSDKSTVAWDKAQLLLVKVFKPSLVPRHGAGQDGRTTASGTTSAGAGCVGDVRRAAAIDVQDASVETTGGPAQAPNDHVNSVDFVCIPTERLVMMRQGLTVISDELTAGKTRSSCCTPARRPGTTFSFRKNHVNEILVQVCQVPGTALGTQIDLHVMWLCGCTWRPSRASSGTRRMWAASSA
ncbi:hypothetical protein H257_03569 [Aphanomyces astaci]|uniref:Uncharacterized protein n=1 Tax=Aphanomyces astaci TaxID=112090 RepID=W4GZ86_APHAT|nr:hypothetical protein H257_03569 [Aphanomyces astaci]ETV84329.1 hypothetical protein H257_03569 [Aphanomyces astaci]|eukprot:XP_009826021.1 hypothetical protein H257_03569 [Aphanomyces astaci]